MLIHLSDDEFKNDSKKLGRVSIFADGDNTFIAAQSFNRQMSWEKIRAYLANSKEGRELIEIAI